MEEATRQTMERAAKEAAEYAAPHEQAKASAVRKSLHADLARIRETYKELVYGRAAVAGASEWLFDNYYIFEREGRLVIRALGETEALPCDEAGLPLIHRYAARFCEAAGGRIDTASITAFLSALDQARELESVELAAFPLFLRAALIHRAAEACTRVSQTEADETAVSDAVRTLHFLTTFDFSEIVEQLSRIERILSTDPAGVYPKMDERSRACYRTRLAEIARKRGMPEGQAAELAVSLAQNGASARTRHVGYYILEQELDRPRRHRRGKAYLLTLWLAPLALGLALGLLLGAPWAALPLYLPLWETLRPLLDYVFMKGVPVTQMPRFELDGVIPEGADTLAVISTLLSSTQKVGAFAQKLEQFYMANGRGSIQFGILADLREARLPERPEDKAVVTAAVRAVAKLNRKYGPHFCLFVRARRFCETQGDFAGWERKRGAILELVRFIKGEKTSIITAEGDLAHVRQVKYLITLDADTGLIMDSAADMVAAAMHPLNAPEVDTARGVVTRGYGILAPRIGVDLESAGNTAFSRVMAGCGGVTAYDNAAGDIYQDLFGEGIFAGKGLIHVDAFYQLAGGALPENRILSHDILEGCFLRAGFLSDVELTDGFPARPDAWFSRLHRWVRGDWQNIAFLGRRIPAADGGRRDSPLDGLSRFKLWDNLRRSLTPVLAFVCLISAAFSPLPLALFLVAAAVLSVAGAGLWNALLAVLAGGPSMLSRKYHCKVMPQAVNALAQGALGYLFLPVHAWTALDALCRALWRQHTGKDLLAWTTSAESETRARGGDGLRRFWPAMTAGLLFLFAALSPAAQIAGAFFIAAPLIAWFSGRPARPADDSLRPADKEILRSYTAAMWRYYEDFAGEDDHFLPPDNVQEAPVHAVAHRTSPTNIGLALLATLAARDFGLIDGETLFRRVDSTVSTMERLPKWHGHLYNWYDTRTLAPLHPAYVSTVDSGNLLCCLTALYEGLRDYAAEAPFAPLRVRIRQLMDNTDMAVLYNKRRKLFHIGYDIEKKERSNIYYDLLMSEARLASYYAVARRIVPKRHWGTLGRTLTRQNGYTGPVSWTGTMFEYLMPHLLLPVYEDSLSAETLRFVLYCQKRRVRSHGVPWGISESGFYAFDAALNYQYEAHGVQKLALKRGMDNDLVVSPYSTFLALPFDTANSLRNLERLEKLGLYGRCGFFEAVDFTAARTGGRGAIVKSYMAHHVGMSIVACANALFGGVMQERFLRNSSMRAAQDLLQEKIPSGAVVFHDVPRREIPDKPGRGQFVREEFEQVSPATPRAHTIANGEYTLVLTDCGVSFSLFRGIDLTKRSDDLLRRPAGVFALARVGKKTVCATAAPFYMRDRAVKHTAAFLPDGALYKAETGSWGLSMRVCLHGQAPCEARALELSNTGSRAVSADLLVYLEPLLAKTADEAAHPAFSRLFLRAAYREDTHVLLFARRPRGTELPAFLAVGFAELDTPFTFELDRTALLTRPDGIASLAGAFDAPFSRRTGAVPDAAAALRLRLNAPAHGKKSVTLLLAAANTDEEAEARLIEARREGFHAILRDAAGKNGSGIESRLAALILPQILFLAEDGDSERAEAKARNRMGQPGLWSLGISGDLPLILFPFHGASEQLDAYVRTHRALRLQGITCDLAITYREGGDYARPQADGIKAVLKTCGSDYLIGARGGVHLVNLSHHPEETGTLLRAVACHIARPSARPAFTPYAAAPLRAPKPSGGDAPAFPFYAGGFVGSDVLIPHGQETPPAPWCHILANQTFGTLVSDRALGCTWAVNAHENKLTPWLNDPVSDNRGELLLLRLGRHIYDLCANARVTFTRNEARYDCEVEELSISLQVHIPGNLMAKTLTVELANAGNRPVPYEIAYYTEPVCGAHLGTRRCLTVQQQNDAVLLCNPWATVSGVGVLAAQGKSALVTGRAAFLAGDWSGAGAHAPGSCAALVQHGTLEPGKRKALAFTLGWGAREQAALDIARMALQLTTPESNDMGGAETPAPEHHVPAAVFAEMEAAAPLAPAVLTGTAATDTDMATADPPLTPPASQAPAYRGQPPYTDDEIEVETPDEPLNRLMSVLRRQFLSARILGRTGFYQCGGAWGFRDQLQDCGAALLLDPRLVKAHIFRCAAHQFREGDVMHWWHQLPPCDGGARGVRTRISDDLLWLPLTVCDYLEKTGDSRVLATVIHYLDGPLLEQTESDRYFAPGRSDEQENVYGHCVRAIERASAFGAHGLPLFGAGDWNDGMNLVGAGGKGESVWLALFLAHVLDRFAPICRGMHDDARAETYTARAQALREAVDTHCWDGAWYLRGFYDDGAPLGGKTCDECKIDILPQAFAAIADMPDAGRRRQALDSMLEHLADGRLKLVKLFTPPFDHGMHNPGYIRSYPPGIRENGGQYTHGAVWAALGLLSDGRADDAWRILQWLNPVGRALDAGQARIYRLEPYAMAGDISSNLAIEGRGGWSLYTGAAGWYYRVVLEHLLGLHIRAKELTISPSLPSDWNGFSAHLRLRGSDISLRVKKGGAPGLTVNGDKVKAIPLDGRTHTVRLGI
ncbi:GH36-type glycosyl hydrolase domain-containing protein [Ethanoligenens harbinense]|uniref:Carbohydrate binding protein n=1 Tax=Ethanoligenens harbinense (strain DSM 18485 / JCM 12961 / CGMCC 1.5033 / YUAN-3) TaxID=663278 RepID=E6U8M2_ETHHY|nr:glucoamylase family protein [Ethanoligenens harbinense]ADU26013.1 carbohydrate binding protein [Ethanoligenens harbinense YUAN-3]